MDTQTVLTLPETDIQFTETSDLGRAWNAFQPLKAQRDSLLADRNEFERRAAEAKKLIASLSLHSSDADFVAAAGAREFIAVVVHALAEIEQQLGKIAVEFRSERAHLESLKNGCLSIRRTLADPRTMPAERDRQMQLWREFTGFPWMKGSK